MGIEDDFYATIKFKCGEEVFAKIAATEEEDEMLLLLTNPIMVSEVKTNNGTGYKIEPWLKTTKEDMFIINFEEVLTMSESSDIEMIVMYQDYVRSVNKIKSGQSKIDRKMGYISNVRDAKEILEKIYKSNN